MPRPIAFATVGSHSLSNTASVSGALVGDGSIGSATPGGRCRLVSLECTISGGAITAASTVTSVYLAKDSAGKHPITETTTNSKTGTLAAGNIAGFAIRLEQDAYLEGPVYAVAKLASGKTGTGVWKLTFVQGG